MTSPTTKKSDVKLIFLDPLGRGIVGLKYQVGTGEATFIRGVSDAEGAARPFSFDIGTTISVYVERFGSSDMKKIKTITLSQDKCAIKLFSIKVKETIILEDANGTAGTYRRKTKIVEAEETIESIAKKNSTSAAEIASLNGYSRDAVLHAGQIIKIPINNSSSESSPTQSVGTYVKSSGREVAVPTSSSNVDRQNKENSIQAVNTQKSTDCGSNGTPKTSVAMPCEPNACLKIGMAGPLIEELNIRLTGFGGSVRTNESMNKFTADTESAIKRFQRDYMDSPETGKVCSDVLMALDNFKESFTV